MKYMVVAAVQNNWYLVRVEASSLGDAEHKVLDLGICGRHEYGVRGATAFDAKSMKTDTFISMAMESEPVSVEEFTEIVEAQNAWIKAKDDAEDKIREIEKQMAQLNEELAAAKRVLAA